MAMTERKSPIRESVRPTLFDRLAFAISPAWGARRIMSRRAFVATQKLQERFARIEAAENNETRGDRWLASRLSPDSQLEQDLLTVRDRSREIYQNDAMGGTVESKVNHVIGTGHKPQSRIKARDGIVTDAEAKTYNEEIEYVYERWNKRADKTGKRSVWQLSRLAERHNEFDGESFTILSDAGRADKPIPLALQVIDPERVNTPPEHAGDVLVRLGIRYATAGGDILGYYVQRAHPGDTLNVSIEYDFIPADRMLHVFEPWFAEQSRGLPWMTRALNRAKDAKDFDEATILRAQIEACHAAFVKPSSGVPGYTAASGASSGTTSSGQKTQDIIPGTITFLDGDGEVFSVSPTTPGSTFAPFQEWNYRRVAAAINWPYEMVVKNWGGLSFAAGRLVLADAKKSTEVGQQFMRELWFERIWNRVVEESVIVGETKINPRLYLEFPDVFNRHVWIAPKWEYALNPGEEVKADVEEIANNLSTLEDKLGKRSYDLEEFIERRKREKELIDAAGLTPAEMPGANRPGEPVAADDDDDDDEDDDDDGNDDDTEVVEDEPAEATA